jgi:hypothetical protein
MRAAILFEVAGGDYRYHAGQRLGGAGIKMRNSGVRHRTAKHLANEHIG